MQSTHILYPLLGVILGAASAGVTVTLFLDQDPPAGSGESAGLSVVPEGLSPSDLQARVQALQDENQALRERLTALELRPPATMRTPAEAGVSRAEFEEFKDELSASLKTAKAVVPESAEMKAQVADAIQEIRKEETLDSIKRAQERQRSQLEDRLAKLSSTLGLDNRQLGQMRDAFLEQIDRDAELMTLWKSGGADEVVGQTKRANATAHRETIAGILTPQQLETYRSSRGKGD